jgi:hypothetical protein
VAEALQTVAPDLLPSLPAIPEGARVVIVQDGAPLQSIPVEQLLTKLVRTDLVKQSFDLLAADLTHGADTVALVVNDAVLLNNGWYRKTGATGAGAWAQFETLAKPNIDALDARVAAIETGGAAVLEPTTGTAVGGETSIAAPFAVPTGSPWWVDLYLNGVLQTPGIDFTSDATTTLHLSFALSAGDRWMVRQHRSA